jgi:hypothetical protein
MHYDNGILKPYYQDRQNLIESDGWILFQLHYTHVYKKCVIDDVIKRLNDTICERIEYTHYVRPSGSSIKEQYKKKVEENKKIKQDIIDHKINVILNSDVDFSKFGWVQKVANLLNIKHQHVVIFIKKHIPDFYNDKCFKKKQSVKSS